MWQHIFCAFPQVSGSLVVFLNQKLNLEMCDGCPIFNFPTFYTLKQACKLILPGNADGKGSSRIAELKRSCQEFQVRNGNLWLESLPYYRMQTCVCLCADWSSWEPRNCWPPWPSGTLKNPGNWIVPLVILPISKRDSNLEILSQSSNFCCFKFNVVMPMKQDGQNTLWSTEVISNIVAAKIKASAITVVRSFGWLKHSFCSYKHSRWGGSWGGSGDMFWEFLGVAQNLLWQFAAQCS